MNKKNENKLIVKNKKAYFDYDILDTWEAGIELKGYETKSIRQGYVNLKGSYITCVNQELFIKNMHVSVWKTLANKDSIDTFRDRKIFLHKKIIIYLCDKLKQAGFSVIPLELYFKGSLIKLKVALTKGRKLYQKKQILKERDMDKQAKIILKKFL